VDKFVTTNIFMIICDTYFRHDNSKTFKVMTSTYPLATLCSVVPTFYLEYRINREIYTPYAGVAKMLLQHIFCHKVSFIVGTHCQFLIVCQGMKQT